MLPFEKDPNSSKLLQPFFSMLKKSTSDLLDFENALSEVVLRNFTDSKSIISDFREIKKFFEEEA